ncbi:DUF7344 domain-containing protein [Halovivax limisalsi]|uniref:DUF7344 domain-containing protein n=1 Tax=Halovivax limisalsi TaxID=1453760 RepID=UPI001FFC4E50|nr:ArsR family transcriptional regulator [Halovivax limisalsi]
MDSPIDPTGAFGLLSDLDRRRVLSWFEIQPVWSIHGLATKLAIESVRSAQESTPPQTPSGERIRTKRLELVHNHLPRLADHDIVEWDRRSGDVVRSDRYEAVIRYLESLGEHERETERPRHSSDRSVSVGSSDRL